MAKNVILVALAWVLAVSGAGAASLPSRDPRVVVPLLRAFQEHGSFDRVVRILGRPEEEAISGYSITIFRLEDGTSVYVKATPGRNRIFGISRSAPGGLAETLYDPLGRDLRHPVPASAPF